MLGVHEPAEGVGVDSHLLGDTLLCICERTVRMGRVMRKMALHLVAVFHAMQQRKGRKREVCTTHGLGSSGSVGLALVDVMLQFIPDLD